VGIQPATSFLWPDRPRMTLPTQFVLRALLADPQADASLCAASRHCHGPAGCQALDSFTDCRDEV
jgi:hypothetical protein